MSVKDQRFYRKCPICEDILPGTDDGAEVYNALKDQLAAIAEGDDIGIPNCTLCGEECESIEAANAIVALGEPKLRKTR